MSHALPREWFGTAIRNDGLKREQARLRAGSIFLYLAAVSLPVAALLFYILQGVQVIRTGYEIDQLRDRLQTLRTERDRLEVELASLQNLDVVETLALRDLAMIRPAPGQVVVVRRPAAGTGGLAGITPEDKGGEPSEGSRLLAFLRRVTGAL